MAAVGSRTEADRLSPAPLDRALPGLKNTPFAETSPADIRYNCIAWAVGDKSRWWWPKRPYYWPPTVPATDDPDSFIALFAERGFEVCDSPSVEPDFEKIAVFVDPQGKVKHAARQLPSGMWTSKLGQNVDIAHRLEGVEGKKYGRATIFMRRSAGRGRPGLNRP